MTDTNQAYKVIARKWRPQKFSEIVGQEHITRTLKNAIRLQRTAHAYLFVGPRGIGKTTTARIFAKAVNCQNPEDGEPCCQCSSCVSITEGNCLDLIEIDAASNTGVDNVRSLRDEIIHVPMSNPYKIYIIDEVHMLSKGAWNALLKMVEEPPAHVKFIFATTEVHKVLPTIISRCQRFDLHRIPSKLIAERLSFIAESEGIKISQTAINAIARAADGGMRDGQSLLDQMISFFGTESADNEVEISEEQVLSLFGLTDIDDMAHLVESILTNNKSEVIGTIHKLAGHGKDLEKLFEDLLSWLRGIQICQLVKNDPDSILEVGEETICRYRHFGEMIKPAIIQRLLETLSQVGFTLHNALNKQVFLETIILKSMRLAYAVQIDDLLSRLNQLRKNGELNIPSHPQSPPASGQSAFSETRASFNTTPSTPTPKTPVKSPITNPAMNTGGKQIKAQSSAPAQFQQSTGQPARTPTPTSVKIQQKPSVPTTQPSPKNVPPVSPEKPPIPKKIRTEHTPESLWHKLIEETDHIKNPILKGYMLEGHPESFDNGVLKVFFDEEYEKEHTEVVKKELSTLLTCLHRITGNRKATIKIEQRKGISSPNEIKHFLSGAEMATIQKKVEGNQFVKKVSELFSGEIVDVHG